MVQVAEDVEVAEPVELAVQLAPTFGVVAAEPPRLVANEIEHAAADLLVGLEVAQPFDELALERFGAGDRLTAAFRVATGRAEVAANAGAGAASAVHAGAAALAVEELAEEVVIRRAAGLEHAGAPEADLLDAVEELLVDERLMQAADRAVLAAESADVAAVGGVHEHLADGVLAERAVLGGADAADVEPLGERAVGLLPGRVALEQLADELGPLRIGDGESRVALADVAPGKRADEMPLPRLLAQSGAGPERERDGVAPLDDVQTRCRLVASEIAATVLAAA